MRASLLFVGLSLLQACAAPEATPWPDLEPGRPRPTETQVRWQEAEFGVVFHYDLHTCADGRYVQSRNRVEPFESTAHFTPDELDTDQWVAAAKAAGARFAIITASHETGFRLWQSDANPFSMGALEWGNGERDIVGEFHASCLRHGVLPGIYLGTRWNAKLGVYDFKVTERSTITQEQYNRLIEAEVEEVCTRYGDWFEFWFDGGAHGPAQGGPDVLRIVEQHQPDAVFYHSLDRADARWGGSESGTVPYPCWATFPFPVTGAGESARAEIAANGFELLKRGDPGGEHWLPAMSDAPLRGHGGHEWFWEPGDERLIYPLQSLVDMVCRSVGHNSTLILGLTPDDRGLLPDADVARLRELGQRLDEMFGESVAVRRSVPGAAELEAPFLGEHEFDIVVLQEDIREGERVRDYELQVQQSGSWITFVRGSCIGHKRIHRLPERLNGSAVRVRVNEASGPPLLESLAVHLDRGR